MGTTQKVVGTSLEVLAPFLPYGIEVEYPLVNNPYGDSMRRRLVGLNSDSGIATLSNETTIWAPHCVPVLRPFSALATPLEDGTVPLLEIMKLALPTGESFSPIRKTQDGDMYVLAHIGSKAVKCWLTDEWDIQLYGWGSYEPFVKSQVAILDYLRRNHFAVGLNASQFIEKTPVPTPSTIQQKGGGEL